MLADRRFFAAWWTGWSALLGLFEAVAVTEWQLDQHGYEEPKPWVIPLAIGGFVVVVVLGIVFGFRSTRVRLVAAIVFALCVSTAFAVKLARQPSYPDDGGKRLEHF